MLRWGILSTAKIAREHVIPAHLKARDNCVTTIASRDPARAQVVADQFQIPNVAANYEALLQSDQVDAVYIPLPTSQHVEWAIHAANAGKHVLVEKPLALKAEDILAVQAAAKANNIIVAEAFMVHYHPQWKQVSEWLEQGAIGRLRHIQSAFSYYNRDPSNMRNKPELGGGGIPDIGVYPTVTARMTTGKEPLKVRADVEIDAPFNAELYGDVKVSLWNQNHTEVQTVRYGANVNQYQLQAEAFADAVASGDASELFSLDDSIANQKALDAILASNETGTWAEV